MSATMTASIGISAWLSPVEIDSMPEPTRSKVNSILNDYHLTVVNLQSDISFKISFYEKTIEDLKGKLREETQKCLELEMTNLKHKTLINEYSTSRSDPKTVNHSTKHCGGRHAAILRRKIHFLTEKAKQMELKEQSLNAQVNFLTENYDKDSKELCTIVGEYLTEISLLRQQIESSSYESLNKIKKELEILRTNEREYQAHIYEKTKEIHGLYSEVVSLKSKCDVLEEYRVRYKNLNEEFMRISGELSESRMRNAEMKVIRDCVMEGVSEFSKNVQILMHNSIRILPKNSTGEGENAAEGNMRQIKSTILTIRHVLEAIKENKVEIEGLFRNLMWTCEEQNKKILDQSKLIDKYNSTSEEASNNIFVDQIDLLKMENEALKTRIGSIKPASDLLSENESVLRQNRVLISDIEKMRDEIDRLNSRLAEARSEPKSDKDAKDSIGKENSAIGKLRLTIDKLNEKVIAAESTIKNLEGQIKMYKEDVNNLEDENYHLLESINNANNTANTEAYIKDLESQLSRYKSDVRSIEGRFLQYKELYESFNIEESMRRAKIMKENISKKNALIGKMSVLIEMYRKTIEIYSMPRN
ncbi:uncharacterized protein VICG_01833 [Vittaforma corneae ATCC 50505]|uniref:Uncharacterized protein n=1 Tax=Vittaforma corneae (strain ATCC 50505) TaxID=993615 RepID=L2GKJ5_VITCO|nr:uncharacterized protein VICG_01833 [Vittaforma corneae ATCC 50505]ELA41134.1 hypothetical protein VICG_01833 [Vittaforma corneae ATCC 50505]